MVVSVEERICLKQGKSGFDSFSKQFSKLSETIRHRWWERLFDFALELVRSTVTDGARKYSLLSRLETVFSGRYLFRGASTHTAEVSVLMFIASFIQALYSIH